MQQPDHSPSITAILASLRQRSNRQNTIILGGISIALIVAIIVGIGLARRASQSIATTPLQATATARINQQQFLNSVLLHPDTLTWGGDASFGPPYIYTDASQNNATTGLEYDVMTALAKELGVKPQYTQVTWSQFPIALQQHQVDLFLGTIEPNTIPPQDATFTEPYLIMTDRLVVRANDTRFTDIGSLKGHTIGVVNGDRAADYAKTLTDSDFKTYDHILPFEALAQGRIDAILINAPLATWYANHDALKRFKVLTNDYHPGAVAIAGATKGGKNTEFLLLVSLTLKKMAADGTLAAIYKQWGVDGNIQNCILAPTTTQGCP